MNTPCQWHGNSCDRFRCFMIGIKDSGNGTTSFPIVSFNRYGSMQPASEMALLKQKLSEQLWQEVMRETVDIW